MTDAIMEVYHEIWTYMQKIFAETFFTKIFSQWRMGPWFELLKARWKTRDVSCKKETYYNDASSTGVTHTEDEELRNQVPLPYVFSSNVQSEFKSESC